MWVVCAKLELKIVLIIKIKILLTLHLTRGPIVNNIRPLYEGPVVFEKALRNARRINAVSLDNKLQFGPDYRI